MREIYGKQQNNLKYEYDTPVPFTRNFRNSKQKNYEIEESLGYLAPKLLD